MGESDLVRLWMNKGWYEIRAGEREGSFGSRSPHFYKILADLVEYHNDCVISENPHSPFPCRDPHNSGITYAPKLVRWEKKIEAELPKFQLAVLEGIINMHNQVVDARVRREAAIAEL